MDVSDHSAIPVGIQQITNTYVIPPVLPGQSQTLPETSGSHAAPFNGPGAVAGDSPSRIVNLLPGTVTGFRHFTSDIFDLHLGPYIELPLGKRVTAGLSRGFRPGVCEQQFQFQ